MATLAAINKGAARWPGGRQEIMAIANLAASGHFRLRALHISGVDNPADGPSRGQVAVSQKDFTFMFFSTFASVGTTVDCCAAADGYNAQPGCSVWFSANNPVQLNVDALMHQAIWAAPPWDIAGQVLDTLVAAWRRAPHDTEATVVLPYDPTRSWFRFYFRRPAPLFRILHRYPALTPLYFRAVAPRRGGLRRFPHKPAKVVDVPVMVVRLGARHV